MKAYIKTFTIAVVLLYALVSGAQNKDLYNVKMRSGLTIKCELISFLPDSMVSIRQYGLVSTIHSREIISIEYSGFKPQDTQRKSNVYNAPVRLVKPKPVFRNLPENVWTCGIQLCLNVNGITPSRETSMQTLGTSVKLSAMTGLGKHLELGFCAGLDAYDEDWLFGVAASQVRYCILANRYKTPLLYTQLGYGFNFSDGDPIQYGGINFAGGIGMSSRTKAQDIFCVMLGFKLQRLMVDVDPWQWNQGWGWTNTNSTQTLVYTLMGAEAKVEWRF